MNSFFRTVLCAIGLLHSAVNFAAACSSQQQTTSLLSQVPSYELMNTPLWKMPKSAVMHRLNPQTAQVTIQQNISGSRGTQTLCLALSEIDYFTALPFHEHIVGDKGFTVLAFFHYALPNGVMGHDIAYAPAFRTYLRNLVARRSPFVHPTHKFQLIGTREYYLITAEDAICRSTFLGTEQEARTNSRNAPLLELFLKDEKTLNDIINIGNCYQEQRNYHEARTWFGRAVSILHENKAPQGQVHSRIIVTFLAEERWQDVISQAYKAFMSVRQYERDSHRDITQHMTTAYMQLINRHITRHEFDAAIGLCHQALTDIKKEEHASRSVILHKLGSMYEGLQKAPLSFYCYKQALEQNPEDAALSLFYILLLFKNNFDVFNSAEYAQDLHQCVGRLLALTQDDRQKLEQSLTPLNLNADFDNVYSFAESLLQQVRKKENEVSSTDEESNCIIS